MLPRRATARATRPIPPRPSSSRPWAARSSAASLPSISIGLGFSGSTCRSAGSPFCSPTTYCSGCRATTVGTSSMCGAPVGAAIPLLLALTWGGRRYAWGSPQILALFVACATLWCLFAWRMTTAKQPFIPVSVLRDGAMRVGTAAAFFAVGVVIALTIVLPLYGQLALGLSVSESGWTIIALQSGAAVTSVVGGRLLVRFVHYKRVPLVSLVLSVAALIPLAIAPPGFSPAAAPGLIALVGLGLGR